MKLPNMRHDNVEKSRRHIFHSGVYDFMSHFQLEFFLPILIRRILQEKCYCSMSCHAQKIARYYSLPGWKSRNVSYRFRPSPSFEKLWSGIGSASVAGIHWGNDFADRKCLGNSLSLSAPNTRAGSEFQIDVITNPYINHCRICFTHAHSKMVFLDRRGGLV